MREILLYGAMSPTSAVLLSLCAILPHCHVCLPYCLCLLSYSLGNRPWVLSYCTANVSHVCCLHPMSPTSAVVIPGLRKGPHSLVRPWLRQLGLNSY